MKCRYIEGSKNGPVTGPFGHGPVNLCTPVSTPQNEDFAHKMPFVKFHSRSNTFVLSAMGNSRTLKRFAKFERQSRNVRTKQGGKQSARLSSHRL